MSTSKLQRQVSILLNTHLGQYTIRENHRPEWLEGLELDFYIEELRVGIEIQGRQHFEYTPHFHGSYDDFLAQKQRDAQKYGHCLHHEIALFYITSPEQAIALVERLAKKRIEKSLNAQAVFSVIGDYLYLNPKTRRWLQSYQRALNQGRAERAERFRQLIIQFIRRNCSS